MPTENFMVQLAITGQAAGSPQAQIWYCSIITQFFHACPHVIPCSISCGNCRIMWSVTWFLLQVKHNIHIEITTINTHYSLCMAYNTVYYSLHVTSPYLGQYFRWSGGHTTVPVWDRVIGLVVPTTGSAGTTSCSSSEWVLKWERFLLTWPEAVSTAFDLGASNACTTHPVAWNLVSTQTGWSSGSNSSVLTLWHWS